MGNILQNSLDVTYEDFLKGVFGARPKPERNALKSLFSEIVTGKSTLVSDLSKPLRENASKAEGKRVQERVSGWLGNYDFVEATVRIQMKDGDVAEALADVHAVEGGIAGVHEETVTRVKKLKVTSNELERAELETDERIRSYVPRTGGK